jgi:hypothetical protein
MYERVDEPSDRRSGGSTVLTGGGLNATGGWRNSFMRNPDDGRPGGSEHDRDHRCGRQWDPCRSRRSPTTTPAAPGHGWRRGRIGDHSDGTLDQHGANPTGTNADAEGIA